MVSIFGWRIRAWVAAVAVAAVLVALVLGFSLLWPPPAIMTAGPPPETVAATDLGFTYLQVTPKVSAYYGLGVDTGAMVTGVAPRSPAARAGIEAGDVIMSFNGDRLEDEAPLLGMMIACGTDHAITMDVWREGRMDTIMLDHMGW